MSVWCLLIKPDGYFATPVQILCDTGLDIDGLRTKLFPSLDWAERAEITVYHHRDMCSDMKKSELATVLSGLDLAQAELPVDSIVSEVVTGNELLIFKKHAPPDLTSIKRPRSPSIDHCQSRKLQKTNFLRQAPSDVAKGSQYWKIQRQHDHRLLDDRPADDEDVPPIPLLYGPFGEFKDIFLGRVPPPTYIDFATLQENLNTMAALMSRSYDEEYQRRDTALSCLKDIFDYTFMAAFIGKYQTDGHSEVEGLVDFIVEVKNEVLGISALPYARSAAYVGQSHKKSSMIEQLCNRWRLPALCLTIVGPQIQFYAILLLGHQYRVVSLTPSLSCALSATYGWDRDHLYKAFAAAIVLRSRIRSSLQSYMRQLESLPPTLTQKEFFFPAINKILACGCNADDEKYIEFKILDYYGERLHYRQLYKASITSTNGASEGNIIVKFSRSYCRELHDYCFKKGYAPKLLGFQQLSTGWFAVAMEYLPNALSINSVLHRSEKDDFLFDLVNGFHAEGLVHGDLRHTNILCDSSGQKIWLIDFDWGGKVGEVQYPTWLLNEELRRGRESKDLKISAADDLRILRYTLESLPA